MANLDGTPSERALAAGSIARTVSKHLDLFVRGKPPRARAAICWNVYANMMWVCMRQPWHCIPSRSYIGAYRALYQEHIPADFVHADQISEGKLEGYRVLYLPFAFMVPRSAAAQIDAFIAQGGIVVAEARTAWNDETGYCGEAVPGFGLEKVFGCREQGAQGVDEDAPVRIRIIREHPALPLLHTGDVVVGARFHEVLEPLSSTAEVVGEFEDGSPAIVVNRHGEGWAIFVGTLLSFSFYKFGDENAGKLLKGPLRPAGIRPPVTVEAIQPGLAIEPAVLEGTDDSDQPFRIFFAFNHTDQPAQPQFGIAIPQGNYAATDIVTNESVPCRFLNGRLVLSKRLEPGEIWVVKIIGTTPEIEESPS